VSRLFALKFQAAQPFKQLCYLYCRPSEYCIGGFVRLYKLIHTNIFKDTLPVPELSWVPKLISAGTNLNT